MNRLAVPIVLLALLVPVALAGCGKAVGDTIADATITTRVKTALLNDPDIGVLRIDVETTLGVVTLKGTVKSEAEKARAAELTRAVPGVKDVKVDLEVAGRQRAELLRPAKESGSRLTAHGLQSGSAAPVCSCKRWA